MPKSKVRKKKNPSKKMTTSQASPAVPEPEVLARYRDDELLLEPRDPELQKLLAGRGWRYHGASQPADCWDFPGLHEIDMNSLISILPNGYCVDSFLEGSDTPFKSVLYQSREGLIEGLDFIESWGHEIIELRKAVGIVR